jgi:SAM-dependent methyltransferase
MTTPAYDHDFWESLWAKTLRDHADKVASRPPSSYLTTEASKLRPGRALDAGCGHGAESLWLAAYGWRVTGVDFSNAALEHARAMAEAAGSPITERIDFVQANLTSWAPAADAYDLVVSLYVHVPGSVEEMVQRMAAGVTVGGTLLLVGHRPVDPATGAPTAAAGQAQVSVEVAVAALEPRAWTFAIAEERPRTSGSGVDAVICARRVS